MAFKDKGRQREAVKQAVRRYRAKNKDSALSGQKGDSVNAPGLTEKPEVSNTPVIPHPVIPRQSTRVIPFVILSEVVRMDSSLTFTGELTKTRQLSQKGFNG